MDHVFLCSRCFAHLATPVATLVEYVGPQTCSVCGRLRETQGSDFFAVLPEQVEEIRDFYISNGGLLKEGQSLITPNGTLRDVVSLDDHWVIAKETGGRVVKMQYAIAVEERRRLLGMLKEMRT